MLAKGWTKAEERLPKGRVKLGSVGKIAITRSG